MTDKHETERAAAQSNDEKDEAMTTTEVVSRLRALARHSQPSVLSMDPSSPWRQACIDAANFLEEHETKRSVNTELVEDLRAIADGNDGECWGPWEDVKQILVNAADALTQSANASSDVVRDGQRHALVEVICALQERVESLAVQLISAQKDTEQWRFKLRLACDAGMAAHRGDSEWNALNDLLRQSFDAARSSVEPVESRIADATSTRSDR